MTDFTPNIWRLQAQRDVTGLVAALQNEDANIRRRAAAALHALDAKEARDALKTALDKENDPDVRANFVTALAYLDTEAAASEEKPADTPNPVAQHIAQLNSPTSDQVIAAAKALGELKNKLAVEPLILMFRNSSVKPPVRLAVAEALLALDSAPAEVTLLGALRSKQWHLRRNAAAILGQLRADWAIEPLSKALHDDNELVSRTARAALKRIGTKDALKALESAPPESKPAAESTPASSLDATIAARPADGQLSGLVRLSRAMRSTNPLDPKVVEEAERKRKTTQESAVVSTAPTPPATTPTVTMPLPAPTVTAPLSTPADAPAAPVPASVVPAPPVPPASSTAPPAPVSAASSLSEKTAGGENEAGQATT